MLKFAAFSASIDLGFWSALSSLKIDLDHLDDSPREIQGSYASGASRIGDSPCTLLVQANAFSKDDWPGGFCLAQGIIKNTNTIEAFKSADRQELLQQAGHRILGAIESGEALDRPSVLATYVILCFADLKKYRFTYLFGYPGIQLQSRWSFGDVSNDIERQSPTVLQLSARDASTLGKSLRHWQETTEKSKWGFFLVARRFAAETSDSQAVVHEAALDPGPKPDASWTIGELRQYENGFFDDVPEQNRFFGFQDPSSLDGIPGWPLKNFLALISMRFGCDRARIICFRAVSNEHAKSSSFILNLTNDLAPGPALTAGLSSGFPKITGWERAPNSKISIHVVDLADYMDPLRIAEQAVDLNLKLMKWRLAPDLDLDIMRRSSCLLLGAGTLGSYISRNLLSWGFRKITFVDNGKVSYSNPVRQPLYTFHDCAGGGSPKATQAAKALRDIFPGVDSSGHIVSVPMPGHSATDIRKLEADVSTIIDLICQHDLVFLLTDSRESRWLPTLLGRAHDRKVFTVAIGFDSFVVMQHSVNIGANLSGCYFCNDVVAPLNSMSDRTLDQQCTVTRPGIAAIASALAVEIAVSSLQDEIMGRDLPQDSATSPPKRTPHQIRGYLSDYRNIIVQSQRYDKCSACSERMLQRYEQDGMQFLVRALTEDGYIDSVSGLAEVQQATDAVMSDLEWDDDE